MKQLVRLAFLLFAALATPALAQDGIGIAAVVNDEAISVLDLEQRIRMVAVSSRLQDSPELRAKLAPQVLRSLIDERIKLQEAKRFNVTVSDRDVDRRIGELAEQNGMDVEAFLQALARSGILLDQLTAQIRAEAAWGRLVAQRMRSKVNIGDEEIDQALREIAANQGKPEFRVSEIFLAFDGAAGEAEIGQAAERLAQQVREGADFAAVARQFSQASTAASGGDLGWIRPGQLDPALDALLPGMQPGQLAGPVRSTGGFYLILLRDRRLTLAGQAGEGKVSLKQLFIPLPENASAEQEVQANERARQAIARINSCPDMDVVGAEIDPRAVTDHAGVSIGDLDDTLRTLVLSLPINQPSQPVRVATGIGVVVVCARETGGGALPTRVEVAERLARERLDLLSRSYLRDLRRAAYVDIRV